MTLAALVGQETMYIVDNNSHFHYARLYSDHSSYFCTPVLYQKSHFGTKSFSVGPRLVSGATLAGDVDKLSILTPTFLQSTHIESRLPTTTLPLGTRFETDWSVRILKKENLT